MSMHRQQMDLRQQLFWSEEIRKIRLENVNILFDFKQFVSLIELIKTSGIKHLNISIIINI